MLRDKKILIKNSAFLLHEIQISITHEPKKKKIARFLSKTSLLHQLDAKFSGDVVLCEFYKLMRRLD